MTRRPDFRRAAPTGRDLAIEVVYLCDQADMYAHAAWSHALRRRALSATAPRAGAAGAGRREQGHIDPRERRLAMEIAFGSIRRRSTLDWCIERASGRSMDQIDPLARAVLRTGAYQLLFMSRVPPHSAVAEAVESAKRLGHKGVGSLANAVLRKISSPGFDPRYPDAKADPVRAMAVTLSYPEWLVSLWVKEYGADFARVMLEAGNESPQVVLRTNSMRISREELIASLDDAQIQASPGVYAPEAVRIEGAIDSVESLPGYAEGHFSVQDESSMLVAHVLGATAGSTVLDVCAAPGGKTTHIAELTGDRARIIASDISADRVALVAQSAQRLGLESIEVVQRDARRIGDMDIQADAVLVDAPCSGLGVLGRRADARWRKSPDVTDLARLQAEILDSAAECVAPGGVLVYSTCTIGRAENQDQVAAFLSRHSDFSPSPIAPHLPTDVPPTLRSSDSHIMELLPGISGTDGFFIARVARTPAPIANRF